jgi:hypothetical protein
MTQKSSHALILAGLVLKKGVSLLQESSFVISGVVEYAGPYFGYQDSSEA